MTKNVKYFFFFVSFSLYSQISDKHDSCYVLRMTQKNNGLVKNVIFKGEHTSIKFNNGLIYVTSEFIDFSDSLILLTKGYNAIDRPYVGDTVVKISDIKWILWDGIPRKKLKTKKHWIEYKKIIADCKYKGWNYSHFKNENIIR